MAKLCVRPSNGLRRVHSVATEFVGQAIALEKQSQQGERPRGSWSALDRLYQGREGYDTDDEHEHLDGFE